MKLRLTYLLLALVFIGCSSEKELEGKDYLGWVKNPENGLLVKKELGEVSFSAQFKPYDFIVLNEEKEYNLSTELVNARRKKLEGMSYYNLRIATVDHTDILAKGVSDKAYYMQRLDYLSYDFQQDVTLVTESDSINCSLYHFVQGHGVVPYVDMVLGFPIEQKISK